MSKVFEIGLPKTGTTSLGKAFKILAYDHQGVCHDSHAIAYDGSKECGPNTLPTGEGLEKVLLMIEEHEAFEDGPWHNIDFRTLDERFPGSKFIWLDRDDESWYRSFENHFGRILKRAWYVSRPDKDYWIEMKQKKYAAVKAYFENRPQDLLVMNLVSGEGWPELCSFLGKPVPNVPFPAANATKKGLVTVAKNRVRSVLKMFKK